MTTCQTEPINSNGRRPSVADMSDVISLIYDGKTFSLNDVRYASSPPIDNAAVCRQETESLSDVNDEKPLKAIGEELNRADSSTNDSLSIPDITVCERRENRRWNQEIREQSDSANSSFRGSERSDRAARYTGEYRHVYRDRIQRHVRRENADQSLNSQDNKRFEQRFEHYHTRDNSSQCHDNFSFIESEDRRTDSLPKQRQDPIGQQDTRHNSLSAIMTRKAFPSMTPSTTFHFGADDRATGGRHWNYLPDRPALKHYAQAHTCGACFMAPIGLAMTFLHPNNAQQFIGVILAASLIITTISCLVVVYKHHKLVQITHAILTIICAILASATITICAFTISVDRRELEVTIQNASLSDREFLYKYDVFRANLIVNSVAVFVSAIYFLAVLTRTVLCLRRRGEAVFDSESKGLPRFPVKRGGYFWLPLPAKPKRTMNVLYGPTKNGADSSYFLTVTHRDSDTEC